MAECIYFESTFLPKSLKHKFKPENCKEWTVINNWSLNPTVIQEIRLKRKDEHFESYFYVDLEIVSVFQRSNRKISKSERMASDKIKFLIHGYEYSCFPKYSGTVHDNSENYPQGQMYQYKITLTPIFQFTNEIFRKPGKHTKIDLFEGLRILSNDIISLKNEDEFSDVILYCGYHRVKAHRNILSARSTLFNQFFHGLELDVVQNCLELEIDNNVDEHVLINNDEDHFINDDDENLFINGDGKDHFVNDNDIDNFLNDYNFFNDYDSYDSINDDDDDDSINEGNNGSTNDNDSAIIHAEKDNEIRNILELKLEINGGHVTDDNFTNDNNDVQVIQAEKENEVQNILKVKSEINGASATDDNFIKDNNYVQDIQAGKNKNVQNILELKPEINIAGATDDNFINANNDVQDIQAGKNKEVQNVLDLKLEIHGGDVADENSIDSYDGQGVTFGKKENKLRNALEIKLEINSGDTTDKNFTNNNYDATVIHAEKDNEVQKFLETNPEIDDNATNGNGSTNDDDDDATATHARKDNDAQNYFKVEQICAFNNISISALPREEGEIVRYCSEIKPEMVLNEENGTSALFVEEEKGVKICLNIERDSPLNDANGILVMPAEENNESQNYSEEEPVHELNNNDTSSTSKEEENQAGESNDNSSTDSNIIKIRLKKIHPSIFGEFIDFIYSGMYTTFDIKKAKDLLIAALDYGICDLENKCIIYLKSQISVNTCEDMYNFASECKCEKLQIYVLDYVKNKIVGRRRRHIEFIQVVERQENDGIEEEQGEEMTQNQMRSWLEKMRNHPTYLKDILKLKKGKKIRHVFSIVFPEIDLDENDINADCAESLECILNACSVVLDNEH